MVLLLAGEKPDTVLWGQPVKDEEAGVVNEGPYLKVGTIAHATLVTKEDFEGTKSPLAFICVENDQLFPDDVREAGEKYLNENKVENEFKIYPNVPHGMFMIFRLTLSLLISSGFGVVGEYEDSLIKAAQTEAFDQMLGWLKAH